jgi:hypothetical protein
VDPEQGEGLAQIYVMFERFSAEGSGITAEFNVPSERPFKKPPG